MNYYKHHIGDYARDTAHLSMLEDAAYRRMLDLYYASEKPLPGIDALCRLIRVRSKDERKAVDQVLNEFFEHQEDGWHQRRCDAELEVMQAKAGTNRDNGKKGGRPKREPKTNPQETQSVSEPNPKITLATTHKPLPTTQNKTAAARRVPCPDGFPAQLWEDFQATRGKNPVTETALAGIEREALKAGLTLEQAVRTACERGWRSFKADWLEAKNGSKGNGKFNVHAYTRGKLAEALAAEALGDGAPQETVIALPEQVHEFIPRSGNG